jgi:hypothetical protein
MENDEPVAAEAAVEKVHAIHKAICIHIVDRSEMQKKLLS